MLNILKLRNRTHSSVSSFKAKGANNSFYHKVLPAAASCYNNWHYMSRSSSSTSATGTGFDAEKPTLRKKFYYHPSKLMAFAENLRTSSSAWNISDPSRIAPLEQLAPYFIIMFLMYHQCGYVHLCSPIISTWKEGNTLKILSMNEVKYSWHNPWNYTVHDFISYQHFTRHHQGSLPLPLEPKESLEAFCMLSTQGKCNQIVACFGLLLLQLFACKTQITYRGEKVVGWMTHEGTMNQEHMSAAKFELNFVSQDITNLKLIETIKALKDGNMNVDGVHNVKIVGNDAHIWLLFITESGKVFDMDLSAFQFGKFAPFPFIEEVTDASSPAISGTVARDLLCVPTVQGLVNSVFGFIDSHVRVLETFYPDSGNIPLENITETYSRTIDMTLANMDDTLHLFEDPEHFWEKIESLFIVQQN